MAAERSRSALAASIRALMEGWRREGGERLLLRSLAVPPC